MVFSGDVVLTCISAPQHKKQKTKVISTMAQNENNVEKFASSSEIEAGTLMVTASTSSSSCSPIAPSKTLLLPQPTPCESLYSLLHPLLTPHGIVPELILCITDFLPQGLCPLCNGVHASPDPSCATCNKPITWCKSTPRNEKAWCSICTKQICRECKGKTGFGAGGFSMAWNDLCGHCFAKYVVCACMCKDADVERWNAYAASHSNGDPTLSVLGLSWR